MANEAVNKEAKGSQEVASLISQISDGIKGGIEKAQELAVETEKHKQIKHCIIASTILINLEVWTCI